MSSYEAGRAFGRLLFWLFCCGSIFAVFGVATWLIVRTVRGSRGASAGQGAAPPVPFSPVATPPGNNAASWEAATMVATPVPGTPRDEGGASRDFGAPDYPGSVLVKTQTMSSAGGGGGAMYWYVSTDPVEQVAAFYRAHFGQEAGEQPEWHWPGPTLDSGRTLTVSRFGWGPGPELDRPAPPGARTMVLLTYYSRG